MKVLAGGCRIFSSEDGPISATANTTSRTVIARSTGADRITQTVHDYAPGISPAFMNPTAEEALYVISGEGVCRIDGHASPIRSGCAVFVPPKTACSVENPGPATLRILSAC